MLLPTRLVRSGEAAMMLSMREGGELDLAPRTGEVDCGAEWEIVGLNSRAKTRKREVRLVHWCIIAVILL